MRTPAFIELLTESQFFTADEIDSIVALVKTNTVGQMLSACRKLKIRLSDMLITDLTRRFINV